VHPAKERPWVAEVDSVSHSAGLAEHDTPISIISHRFYGVSYGTSCDDHTRSTISVHHLFDDVLRDLLLTDTYQVQTATLVTHRNTTARRVLDQLSKHLYLL
jgi:hypothetical protein